MRYALALLAILLTSCQDTPPIILTQHAASETAAASATTSPSALTEIAVKTDAPGTPPATATPTEAPSPTGSIIEVTPLGGQPTFTPTPCGQSICEVGPLLTLPPPGEITVEAGKYTPCCAQNVRECAGITCAIVASLAAGGTSPLMGFVRDNDSQLWLCLVITTDKHGAQDCSRAAIWLDKAGKIYGKWTRDQ